MMKQIQGEHDYKLIDLLKFLCAYLVIEIHTHPFQSISILLDKFFYYNISNYAVPFFYACTGYFLVVNQPGKSLHTKLIYRIRKIVKIYIMWSIAYLPLTVYGWIVEGNQSLEYALLCVRNYIFVGENFYSWTLWYLNGLIFALFLIDILSKRISIKQIVRFGSGVYLIGVVLTALGSHQDKLPSLLAFLVNAFFSIFVTTRNGLFQSLVFVSLGMYIANREKEGTLKETLNKVKIVALTYLIKIPVSLIGGGQYISQMLDLPIFYILFCLIIYEGPKVKLHGTFYEKLRALSGTIYFVHMYFVALCALVLYKEDYHNFTSFFICAGSATLIAVFFENMKERKRFNR